MSIRISDLDATLLMALAEHRVLTLGLLATAVGRNPNSLRRRLSTLAAQGMVQVLPRRRHGFQGRPEHIITLAESGFDLLRACGRIPRSMVWDAQSVRRTQTYEHELLINDFRVQLLQMERFLPEFRVHYLSRRISAEGADLDATPTIQESFPDPGTGDTIEFVPDGVFGLTHRELSKTLLFFLEADRATEPLTSERQRSRGLVDKFTAYQEYRRTGQYQRYATILRTSLSGFRMLLLVDRASRWTSACRLVRETPPSEFIWLTSRDQLLRHGCWSAIWTVGGDVTAPLQSILGSKMPGPCPSPNEVAAKLQSMK